MPALCNAAIAASECAAVLELWLLSTTVVTPPFSACAAVTRCPIATSSGDMYFAIPPCVIAM